MSTLDRFYVSHNIQLENLSVGSVVLVDYSTSLSDHFPIICSVSTNQKPRSSSQLPYKLNTSHLKNPDCVAALIGIWNSLPKPKEGDSWINWWCSTLNQCVSFLQSFGRRMAWRRKRREKSLHGKLENARKMLNSNPYNENIQNSIAVIEAQLRKLDTYKGQGAKIRHIFIGLRKEIKALNSSFNILIISIKRRKLVQYLMSLEHILTLLKLLQHSNGFMKIYSRKIEIGRMCNKP